MRRDLTVELLVEREVKKLNKTELARVYGCCWETIDRRLNPEKYNKNKKERIYTSKLEPFKKLIDEKPEELNNVVKKLNYNFNYIEKSQAIDEIPANKFINEKEHLFRVNLSILKQYYVPTKTYKVSNESMINYQGVKYSVPIKYIDKYLCTC